MGWQKSTKNANAQCEWTLTRNGGKVVGANDIEIVSSRYSFSDSNF